MFNAPKLSIPMKKLILTICAVLVGFVAFAQIPVGRTVMEYEVSYDDQVLKMNGAGTRNMLFIELYSVGLYLKERSNDAISTAFANETMALRIKITSKLIKREVMLKAIEDGFIQATEGNTASLQKRIDKIREYYAKPIKKGDLLELVYIKDKGIHCYFNNELYGIIEGQDFKFALFKVWLGDNPTKADLKQKLMGNQ